MARKKIGEIWIEAGIITEPVLREALERQKGVDKRLGQILEEMGHVSEKDIAVALASQFAFKTVSGIARHSFPEEVLTLVEGESALRYFIFPLKREDKTLHLAMANPLDMETLKSLSFRTGLRILPYVTTPAEILAAVHRHYFKIGRREREALGEQKRWTVLVVEDEEMTRTAIAGALRGEGYEIILADNGVDGLNATLRHFPQLIIADTLMPRMGGYEMFMALQGNATTRDIPVIALTARAAPEEEARLLDKGYFDFIPKPVNAVRLAARAKRVLRVAYPEGGAPRRPSPEANRSTGILTGQ
jgi:CheY-like chemotaxis protein